MAFYSKHSRHNGAMKTEFALKRALGKGKPSPFPLPALGMLKQYKSYASNLEYFRKKTQLFSLHKQSPD
jgi:hypothetical protein